MHALQPKHSKLKESDVSTILKKFNISINQLPRIKISDSALPENVKIGDVIKMERNEGGIKVEYYRVVIPD